MRGKLGGDIVVENVVGIVEEVNREIPNSKRSKKNKKREQNQRLPGT